jgi:hypothetical protein
MLNTERKMASIKTIDKIIQIDGCDNIELVKIGGWKVIVSKEDLFEVGS